MEGVSSHSSNFQSNSNLNILYFNTRSLLPKFDELLLLTDSHHPDEICITESWWVIPTLSISTLSIPIWSTSHFVNSHLVNVDKVGINEVGIDEVGS